jgi:hypothetical protein
MKSSRSEINGIRPSTPRLMDAMLKETQRAASGSGMSSRETRTTARPAKAMEEMVLGTMESCCSANCVAKWGQYCIRCFNV